eukprot:Ihof_evm2s182 gene=Ihof_evmTU2s182
MNSRFSPSQQPFHGLPGEKLPFNGPVRTSETKPRHSLISSHNSEPPKTADIHQARRVSSGTIRQSSNVIGYMPSQLPEFVQPPRGGPIQGSMSPKVISQEYRQPGPLQRSYLQQTHGHCRALSSGGSPGPSQVHARAFHFQNPFGHSSPSYVKRAGSPQLPHHEFHEEKPMRMQRDVLASGIYPMQGLTIHGESGEQRPLMPMVNLCQIANTPLDPTAPIPVPLLPQGVGNRNCMSRYMRSTFTSVPNSQSLIDQSHLPFGVHIHPFALPQDNDIPVIKPKDYIRCTFCRGYLNPFASIINQGKKWACNLCGCTNTLPEHFTYDSTSGQPIDIQSKLEFLQASNEYIIPAEYLVGPPSPATCLFLIDVSTFAIDAGVVATTIQAIKDNLEAMPGDDKRMIGFITYNSSLHFYQLKANYTQPQMLVVTDLKDEPFLPSPQDLLVNQKDCHAIIHKLLEQLPNLHSRSNSTQSALGPALQSAYTLLAPRGGRIIVFQASLASVGAGSLTMRDTPTIRGSDKEFNQLDAGSEFYRKLAIDCSRAQIGISMFFFGSDYLDIGTLSRAAKYTGGTVHHYPNFKMAQDPIINKGYIRDLVRVLTSPIGMDVAVRIRSSKDIKIKAIHGNFFLHADLLTVPVISSDLAFSVEFSINNPIREQFIYIQSAIVYTTLKGERRVRVHTLCLPITNKIEDVISGADNEAIATLLAKMAIDWGISTKPSNMREALKKIITNFMAISKNNDVAEPTFPLSLAYLPTFIIGLLKHTAFRASANISLDERAMAHNLIKTMPMSQLATYIVPRIYGLHNLPVQAGRKLENGRIIMPPLVAQTAAKLEPHGVYVMDNGVDVYIWISKHIYPELSELLFHVDSYKAIPPVRPGHPPLRELPVYDNKLSLQAHAVIGGIFDQYSTPINITIIKEDDENMRPLFLS